MVKEGDLSRTVGERVGEGGRRLRVDGCGGKRRKVGGWRGYEWVVSE